MKWTERNGAWYAETERGGQISVGPGGDGEKHFTVMMPYGVVTSEWLATAEVAKRACETWLGGDRHVERIGASAFIPVYGGEGTND